MGAKAKKFKKAHGYNADRPQSYIIAMFIIVTLEKGQKRRVYVQF